MRIAFVVCPLLLLSASLACAQPSCGEPPRVDDQSLKGALEGKAQLLTRLVGDANLKGNIEAARTDIFSKYPEARKAHSDTYLLYMFCTFVLSDPTLSPDKKFRAIVEMRQTLAEDETHSGGPNASTKGSQSPAMVSGGDAQVDFGAAPAESGASKPAEKPAANTQPKGSASTEGTQSPAIVSGGNSSVNYANPPPPAPQR